MKVNYRDVRFFSNKRYTVRHSLLEMTRFWQFTGQFSSHRRRDSFSFLCHPLFVTWRASVFIGERKFCIRCSITGKHTLFHGYVQCTKAQNCCWSTNFSIFAQPVNIRKVEGKLVWAFLTEKVFTNRTIPVKSCFSNYEMWGVTRCVSYTQLRYYFRLKRVNYLLESESLTAQDTSRHLLVKVSLLKLNCTRKLWT